MKKFSFWYLIVLLSLYVGVYSCSDEDNDNAGVENNKKNMIENDNENTSNPLVGKWEYVSGNISQGDLSITWTNFFIFNENGTGEEINYGGSREPFTWSLSNNLLVFSKFSCNVIKLTNDELQISMLGIIATYKKVN
jgi:hypothetical protein